MHCLGLGYFLNVNHVETMFAGFSYFLSKLSRQYFWLDKFCNIFYCLGQNIVGSGVFKTRYHESSDSGYGRAYERTYYI